MIESRFPNFADLKDQAGYETVSATIRGKSTWTDPVVTDMLDAAAVRLEPRVSHVGAEPEMAVEVDAEGEKTPFSTWTRTYYFHPGKSNV